MKLRCANCGKEVNKFPSTIKKSKTGNVYCTKSCANSKNNSLFKSGKNHPNYVNGSHSYREVKLRVSENKCEDCKLNDFRTLEVHHLDGNRKNNDISNLVLLCANCHKIRHHNKRKK
jgi:ribosomal protein L31